MVASVPVIDRVLSMGCEHGEKLCHQSFQVDIYYLLPWSSPM
jgi:hypothetical protein